MLHILYVSIIIFNFFRCFIHNRQIIYTQVRYRDTVLDNIIMADIN